MNIMSNYNLNNNFINKCVVLSPFQTRWTWCECETCHGVPRRASNGVQKWRQRLGSHPKWQHTIYLLGNTRQQTPKCDVFLSSLIQCWVRSRPDGRDVSVRHVMGHLWGQAAVFRSAGNDWVRPRSDNVQSTVPFGGHQSARPKIHYFFVISDPKLSPLQTR